MKKSIPVLFLLCLLACCSKPIEASTPTPTPAPSTLEPSEVIGRLLASGFSPVNETMNLKKMLENDASGIFIIFSAGQRTLYIYSLSDLVEYNNQEYDYQLSYPLDTQNPNAELYLFNENSSFFCVQKNSSQVLPSAYKDCDSSQINIITTLKGTLIDPTLAEADLSLQDLVLDADYWQAYLNSAIANLTKEERQVYIEAVKKLLGAGFVIFPETKTIEKDSGEMIIRFFDSSIVTKQLQVELYLDNARFGIISFSPHGAILSWLDQESREELSTCSLAFNDENSEPPIYEACDLDNSATIMSVRDRLVGDTGLAYEQFFLPYSYIDIYETFGKAQ
ncbi:MAG: hypothetical protein LBR25_03300 [Erysipelotrichaceae bacterium]|nr:hypothetical protein [Erysipelotrichaceae bacterium]